MTDMRATERLLEVIEEKCADAERYSQTENAYIDVPTIMGEIREVLTELRRRGDTLVRRDDLAVVIEDITGFNGRLADQDRFEQAYQRLENAIGGKP